MKNWKERERRAAALAYRKGDYAPRVIAKGEGEAAEAIINLAREAGVYVHESPELVRMLMQLDLDRNIPPELYAAVAELLAWLYWLEQGMPRAESPGTDR
jgi:flagellar biosynthesis protein